MLPITFMLSANNEETHIIPPYLYIDVHVGSDYCFCLTNKKYLKVRV